MKASTFKPIAFLFACFSLTSVYGQRPSVSAVEGEVTNSSFTIGECQVSSMTTKYSLSMTAGEPTVFVNIKWTPSGSSSDDCLTDEKFYLLLKVYSNQTGSYYYIPTEGALGVIPKGNGRWGYNPMPGSPNWDELLTKSSNKNPNTNQWSFISADQAKAIWRYELRVSGIEIVEGR